MGYEDDQKAIASVLDGDANAYAALVARYQRPIYNLMYRMSGSVADAADLTQEAFIKAYEQLHRFSQGKRFFPWLCAISLNHCKNFLRKRNRIGFTDTDCELECDLDCPAEYEEGMVLQLDAGRVWEVLGKLPFSYREALILRYHEELSLEDVSTTLGISLSCTKMRIHRGLRLIRESLEKANNGKKAYR